MLEVVAVDENALTADIKVSGRMRRVILRNYPGRDGEPGYIFQGLAGRPGNRGKMCRISTHLISEGRGNPNWHRFPRPGRYYSNGWWLWLSRRSRYTGAPINRACNADWLGTEFEVTSVSLCLIFRAWAAMTAFAPRAPVRVRSPFDGAG